MLKSFKAVYEIICFIGEFFVIMFSDEESRQLDYDNGMGEID